MIFTDKYQKIFLSEVITIDKSLIIEVSISIFVKFFNIVVHRQYFLLKL